MSSGLDRTALTFGAVFVVLGLGTLLDELGIWEFRPGYVLPAVLIAAGVALTVGAFTGDAATDDTRG